MINTENKTQSYFIVPLYDLKGNILAIAYKIRIGIRHRTYLTLFFQEQDRRFITEKKAFMLPP